METFWLIATITTPTENKPTTTWRSCNEILELASNLFRDNRALITVELIDDIENILKFGTDDSHTDLSTNLVAFGGV